jgi:hypothetical protein
MPCGCWKTRAQPDVQPEVTPVSSHCSGASTTQTALALPEARNPTAEQAVPPVNTWQQQMSSGRVSFGRWRQSAMAADQSGASHNRRGLRVSVMQSSFRQATSQASSFFGSRVSRLPSMAATTVTRHRRKSQLQQPVSPQAYSSAIAALSAACQPLGGFDVLNDCAAGGTTTVAASCDFCKARLGVDEFTALMAVQMLDTVNNVVRVPKLVAILKATTAPHDGSQRSSLRPSAAHSGLRTSSDSPRPSRHASGVMHDNVLERLAQLLDLQQDQLRQALAHAGVDPTKPDSRKGFQELIQGLIATEAQHIRLPQGLDAPFIAARDKKEVLGYSVPVWSLRATHQNARPRLGTHASSSAPCCSCLRRLPDTGFEAAMLQSMASCQASDAALGRTCASLVMAHN